MKNPSISLVPVSATKVWNIKNRGRDQRTSNCCMVLSVTWPQGLNGFNLLQSLRRLRPYKTSYKWGYYSPYKSHETTPCAHVFKAIYRGYNSTYKL